MTILLIPFMLLAGIGLVLSLLVHLASFAGIQFPAVVMYLHMGIFVVWLPAAFVANHVAQNDAKRDFLHAVLRGCPGWMTLMVYAFFAYALLNFFLVFFLGHFGSLHAAGAGSMATTLRGFSGHWMAFYSAAFAILYSAIHGEREE